MLCFAELNQQWFITGPMVLALIFVPFILANYLMRRLRMPDYGMKVGFILFVGAASAVITYKQWPPKLGPDLSGGVILIYEIDKDQTADQGRNVDMDKLVSAISKRVNPGGQKEVVVRRYGQAEVEIILPKASEEEVAQAEKTISRAGTLEFRILANRRDHLALIDRATREDARDVRDSDNKELARWVPIEKNEEHSLVTPDGRPTGEYAIRPSKRKGYNFDILVAIDNYNVTGAMLSDSSVGMDQRNGRPCVNFAFNAIGADLFARLTGDNLPDKVQNFARQLGVILDGALQTAPNIQSTISDRGEITGNFTDADVESIVSVLRAGSLPAALRPEPISKLYSGPTLGRDTIEKSRTAMIISSILVPLFMLVYYRFAGLVANIALVLNMLMLVGIMISINAAFTLPGLAGLALTVGMAVDNNVLIYERLREELERGASLRMAIRNAFQRASAVIIDANLTTLLAATILYVIGSDQVKGFAVTLWLGVAISMFTAVWVSRVIFDIAERQKWITQLKMMRLIGETHIDFMSLFRYCITGSIIITVLAIAVSIYRGRGLMDIDFTGGVSVQVMFKSPQEVATVRKLLTEQEKDLPDLAVSDVQIAGEQAGLRFVVNTSQQSMKKVEERLLAVFGDKLMTNSLKAETPTTITAASLEKAAQAAGPQLSAPSQPAAKAPAKPEEKAPAATTPAKPDEKAPAKPEEKAGEKKSSRRILRDDTLLAAVDGGAHLWLADVLAADPKTEAKADAKTDAAKPAAKAEPAAKTEPAAKAERKPEPTKPAAKAEPTPETTKPVSPFINGTQAKLSFSLAVNYQTLETLYQNALAKTEVAGKSVPAFDGTNPDYSPGESKSYTTWDVKVALPAEKAQVVFRAMNDELAGQPYFPATTEIGGAVARGTQMQAVYALVASWIGMIIYLWVRFQRVAFGVAAVVALIHDVFVILGALAFSIYVPHLLGAPLLIEPFKVNLPIVAAFLTIIGYSVNDTIVVFDRIREVRGKDPKLTRKMVNDSINQTLSRTLLTSFTVLLVVVVLYIVGGQAIHGFAFALIVGVATGTYSSIYVAAPILLWLIGTDHVGKEKATPAA